MIPLLVGAMLAVTAVGFVLIPLFDEPGAATRRGRAPAAAPESAGEDSAVEALREIEFDRATGKLSDDDYASLKTLYTGRAVEELRRAPAGGGAEPDRQSSGTAEALPQSSGATPAAGAGPADPAEAAILRHRRRRESCPTCGPRPEPDAIWCSTCGRYLPGECQRCGAAVSERGASVCPACGHALAA